MSIDPVDVTSGGNFNRFGYARQNPYGYIDPDGRADEPAPQVVVITGQRPAPPPPPSEPPRNYDLPRVVPTVQQAQMNPPCVGSSCAQSYMDCLANCIRSNDPMGDGGKAMLTAAGGTLMKAWVGIPRGLGGASYMTTVPSVVAHFSGGGAAGTLGAMARGAGRIASPVWIGYGLYLAGMEGYCAGSCANNSCLH